MGVWEISHAERVLAEYKQFVTDRSAELDKVGLIADASADYRRYDSLARAFDADAADYADRLADALSGMLFNGGDV